MSDLEFGSRVVWHFVFHNGGPQDVLPVASLLLALWTVLAGAYLLIAPPPYPKFFGVRRGHWSPQSFPRKWLVLTALVEAWMIYRAATH